jgi:lysophospholipase L1-like esterase
VPATVSCTRETGSAFPAGLTDIICTATDALSRRAQCTFQVQVNIIAKLKGTKFLAIGDSITEGQVSDPVPIPGFRAVDKLNNYPTQLQGMLLARYPSQTGLISVINDGIGGKQLVDDDEQERFIAAVRSTRPDAVLFLEGTNDLNVATAAEIGNAVRVTIQRAIRESVKVVFVSTLLPQVFGRPKGGHPEAILEANEEIRAAVASQGPNAVLVDSFAAIDPDKARLIGEDGLHPTIEGYRVLAETFLAAIKAHFEAPAAPTRR